MRDLVFAITAATALAASSALMSEPLHAATQGASYGVRTAAGDLSMTQNAQFIYEGRRHCYYRNGWHGPGWYWCGYNFRRGRGWGGEQGWQGWNYGRRVQPNVGRQLQYYRPNSARYRTYNGCQAGWTVQDGLCKPYRGY